MHKSLAIISFFLAIALSLAIGFWLGVREALPIGLMADAAPRGVLASGMLKQLRAGKTENVITLLESDVDGGLLWSHYLDELPLSSLLQPLWGLSAFPNNTEYVTRLADFRKLSPSPSKVDMFDAVPPGKEQYAEFYRDLAVSLRESTKIINEMIAKYASTQ